MEKNKTDSFDGAQVRTLQEGLLQVLVFLLRHKILIFSVTMCAAVGSVVFSYISLVLPSERSPLPNQYQAYAVLILSEQTSSSNMNSMLASLGLNYPFPEEGLNHGELAVRVLRSRPFLDMIIEAYNVKEKYEITKNIKTNSREEVLDRSGFQYDARTGTLTISYTDIDPEFARDVVNSMMNNLQMWFQEWKGTSTKQQLQVMGEKIEEVSGELRQLEEDIMAFQEKYGVLSVEQLAEAQTALITELQSQLIQTEVELKNYSGFSTIEDPAIIQLRAERTSLQDLIEQIERGETNGGRNMPAREALPALALQYAHLQMAHEIQMRIYQSLMEQYEVQKLSNSGETMFSILEPAEVPDDKSGPSRSRLCMIATVMGFLLSIGIALAIDFSRTIRRDTIKNMMQKQGEG